jgi:hypothetical protein
MANWFIVPVSGFLITHSAFVFLSTGPRIESRSHPSDKSSSGTGSSGRMRGTDSVVNGSNAGEGSSAASLRDCQVCQTRFQPSRKEKQTRSVRLEDLD